MPTLRIVPDGEMAADGATTDSADIRMGPHRRPPPEAISHADLTTRIDELEARVKRVAVSSTAIALVVAVVGSGGAVGLAQYLDSRTLRAIDLKLKEQEVQIKEQEMAVKRHEAVVAGLRRSIEDAKLSGRQEPLIELHDALEGESREFIYQEASPPTKGRQVAHALTLARSSVMLGCG